MSVFLMPRQMGGLRYLADFDLCYVNNPKVGCSSVKRAMISMEDSKRGVERIVRNPHAGKHFTGAVAVSRAVGAGRPLHVFSMVRNPYLRALSAYLSKITPRGDAFIRNKFFSRYRLDPRQSIGFETFLRLLEFDAPECMNDHFAPQVVNLAWPVLRYDAMHRLEDASALWAQLEGMGANRAALEARNASGAGRKLEDFYDDTTVALVRRIYAADFEAFGYSTEIAAARVRPDRPIACDDAAPPVQVLLGAALPAFARRTLPPGRAEARLARLRDALPATGYEDWLDWLTLLLLGRDAPDAATRIAALTERRPENWLMLQPLQEIAAAAGQDALAAHLAARRRAILDAHVQAVPGLPCLAETAAAA